MGFIVLFITTKKNKIKQSVSPLTIPLVFIYSVSQNIVCPEIFFDAHIITKSPLVKYRTGKVFSWNKTNKLLNKLSNTVKLLVKKTPWLNLVKCDISLHLVFNNLKHFSKTYN